ncbi:hypothetical protein YQE_10814, partial [Dendroctonus ponderosae]
MFNHNTKCYLGYISLLQGARGEESSGGATNHPDDGGQENRSQRERAQQNEQQKRGFAEVLRLPPDRPCLQHLQAENRQHVRVGLQWRHAQVEQRPGQDRANVQRRGQRQRRVGSADGRPCVFHRLLGQRSIAGESHQLGRPAAPPQGPGLSGRLEISPQGLRVQYQGPAGDLEQMNSFPTIAVWSAVKFVIQEGGSMLHGKDLSYAFMPLITDPDNMDKQALFKGLEEPEKKYIVNEQHAPLFAVVMRKIGVQRQLECHGGRDCDRGHPVQGAGQPHEEQRAEAEEQERRDDVHVHRLQHHGGKGSLYANPAAQAETQQRRFFHMQRHQHTQPLLPAKPPKKSTKSKKAPKAPAQQDVDAIMPYEEPVTIKPTVDDAEDEAKPKSFSGELLQLRVERPARFGRLLADKVSTYMSKEQKQLTAEIKQMVSDSNRGLKRVQSIRKRNEDAVRQKENSGDIFTKVTIPRSGSFLNTGGLTRYKNKASRNNESATGGSPLGFKEIFHELSMQEGLHSMDDILSVIIDPDGMSFNDLKPIYKEFLLKLAVTLTKDELYLKSKSIMRRQRKKTIKKPATGKKHPNKLQGEEARSRQHQRGIGLLLFEAPAEAQQGTCPAPSARTIRTPAPAYRPIKEKGMGGADPSLTYCDCDTDSCAESNKCYCQCSSRARHAHHPKCRKAAHSEQHRKLCKNNSNTKSTRSLEYMSNPSEGTKSLSSFRT